MSSPVQETLAWLRRQRYTCGEVQRSIYRGGRRHITIDYLGIIDIIAVRSKPRSTIGVQVTVYNDVTPHKDKALAEPRLAEWIGAGNKFEIHGWRQKQIGRRNLWHVRRVGMTIAPHGWSWIFEDHGEELGDPDSFSLETRKKT